MLLKHLPDVAVSILERGRTVGRFQRCRIKIKCNGVHNKKHRVISYQIVKLFFLPLLVFATCITVRSDTRDALIVATYNVRNYLAVDRQIDGRFWPDYPKPEAEKTALREVIRQMDADVVALQEMGTEGYLAELRRDLAGEGCHYPHARLLSAEDAERHVAVVSRYPLLDVREHTDMDFAYRDGRARVMRGLLEVSIENPMTGRRVTVFVVHLKSRLTTFSDDPSSETRRAKEAEVIRNRILKRFPDPSAAEARFVIAGDFNDMVTSRPLRAMLKRGNTEIACLLPATDSRGETWTHYYRRDETYSRVDNILVSPALRTSIARIWIVDAPGVLRASDHRPVVLALHWNPSAAADIQRPTSKAEH